jgi:hypothetical protein
VTVYYRHNPHRTPLMASSRLQCVQQPLNVRAVVTRSTVGQKGDVVVVGKHIRSPSMQCADLHFVCVPSVIRDIVRDTIRTKRLYHVRLVQLHSESGWGERPWVVSPQASPTQRHQNWIGQRIADGSRSTGSPNRTALSPGPASEVPATRPTAA